MSRQCETIWNTLYLKSGSNIERRQAHVRVMPMCVMDTHLPNFEGSHCYSWCKWSALSLNYSDSNTVVRKRQMSFWHFGGNIIFESFHAVISAGVVFARLDVFDILRATPQMAKFMGIPWGTPESCRPQMGPMLALWTLLSGTFFPVVWYQFIGVDVGMLVIISYLGMKSWVCSCVIVRPRSNMMIVRKKILPTTAMKYFTFSLGKLLHSGIFWYISNIQNAFCE